MRFIHTADWQIGKPFARFGAKAEALRMARLDAIEAIGRLAKKQDVRHVMVAGDIFDSEQPSRRTLREPSERMRAFSEAVWWLLPGNHDFQREGGVWSRFRAAGLPDNVRVLTTNEPVALEEGVWLLPAPLGTRSETRDLTSFMDEAATPEGATRIGLAHGSIVQFGGAERPPRNPIDPDRPQKAGLTYLALGDWHRTQRIGDRVWYSGTPEPDDFDQEHGQALLVETRGAGEAPKVAAHPTGAFTWRAEEFALDDATVLDDLDAKLRRDAASLSRTVLAVKLSGAVSLSRRSEIAEWRERLAASVRHLDCDESGLHVRPDPADLEAIDFDGVLRRVAERLKARMEDGSRPAEERRVAEDALVTLFVEARSDGAAS
jgi:DNA repair exonuclease SbcCD nuclease subunit